jgi:hypothetical protein
MDHQNDDTMAYDHLEPIPRKENWLVYLGLPTAYVHRTYLHRVNPYRVRKVGWFT